MNELPIALTIFFLFSLLLNYIYNTYKKSAMQIVNEMGLGYNLANLFDCYSLNEEIKSPDEQITLWGNSPPTKETILSIKKNGFKTIRFPVTWLHFIDDSGNVNPEWMSRVKEVVEWIVSENMYCILDIHNDGLEGNWFYQGLSKDKYFYLWTQIANEFKDFDDYLILESMNDAYFTNGNDYDYERLYNLTQTFIEIVRNSGGNNINRLLLISGANTDKDLSCSSKFKIPKDPSEKIAISIHYYNPSKFTLEPDDSPWTYFEDGIEHIISPLTKWGDEANFNDMVTDFENLKNVFVNNGIPIIIGEVGVLTEQQKDVQSIRDYLYTIFSLSSDYEGIMCCLWDTSSKNGGSLNYYNRESNEWYDEKIRDNFKKISRGKYIKPSDYFIYSKTKTISNTYSDGNLYMNIGKKKVLKVIFNAKIKSSPLSKIVFGIASNNKEGQWTGESIQQKEGKKEFDGSYTFTIDVSEKDFNDFVEAQIWDGNEYASFNHLTVEFKEDDISINFNDFKSAILN